MKNQRRFLTCAVLALFSGVLAHSQSASPEPGKVLFADDFSDAKEQTLKEPGTIPERWHVNSGTLYLKPGHGWTGDLSNPMDNSSVFRLLYDSKTPLPRDYEVHFKVKVNRVVADKPEDWYGIHVFLHYRDQFNLYYASIFRADGRVIIKKKLEGKDHHAEGTENGGYYYPLTPYTQIPHPIRPGEWHDVVVGIRGSPAEIWMIIDGQEILRAKDSEKIGDPALAASEPPLLIEAGTTGLRGDFTDFEFSAFQVIAL